MSGESVISNQSISAKGALRVLVFTPEFEPLILSGAKIHTIRSQWWRHVVPGDVLSLRVWSAKPYHSPQREFLCTRAKFVIPIRIDTHRIYRLDPEQVMSRATVVRRDGFENWTAFRNYFQKTSNLPFTGVLIHWEYVPAPLTHCSLITDPLSPS